MSSHQHTHGHTPGHPTHHDASDNTTGLRSSDTGADAHAKPSTKVAGDLKGMAHGVAGSVEAATGTLLRNKNMQEKGFEKMGEEDQRLAAKSGKPPVGTTAVDATNSPGAATIGKGHATTGLSK